MFHRQRCPRVREPARGADPTARRAAARVAAQGRGPFLGMDRGPHHGARDRGVARPALAGLAGRWGNGPVGRPHPARRGLCHDRRPRVLHLRIGIGDRVDRTRIGRGRLAVSPTLLDKVRIRVTPTSPGPPLFVGIGPSTEVDRYLAGVDHTVITEFWGDKTEAVEGGPPASAPGTQDFWVASATGSGPRPWCGIRRTGRGPSW